MSEKSKNGKAEKKQTYVKSDSHKKHNSKTETSSNGGESKSQDKNNNSREMVWQRLERSLFETIDVKFTNSRTIRIIGSDKSDH